MAENGLQQAVPNTSEASEKSENHGMMAAGASARAVEKYGGLAKPYLGCITTFGLNRSGTTAFGKWIVDIVNESGHSYRDCRLHHYNPAWDNYRYFGDYPYMFDIQRFDNMPMDAEMFAYVASRPKVVIILLRDIYNWLASAWKQDGSPKHMVHLRNIWADYAKHFVTRANERTGMHLVYFNQWFQDRDYRIELAKKWGLNTKGDPVQYVQGFSSFDGRRRQEASNLKLLTRYENFQDHPIYLKLITSEVQELNFELFGMACPGCLVNKIG